MNAARFFGGFSHEVVVPGSTVDTLQRGQKLSFSPSPQPHSLLIRRVEGGKERVAFETEDTFDSESEKRAQLNSWIFAFVSVTASLCVVHPLRGWITVFGGALSGRLHMSLMDIVSLKMAQMCGSALSGFAPFFINRCGNSPLRFRTLFVVCFALIACVPLCYAFIWRLNNVIQLWFALELFLILSLDTISLYLTTFVSTAARFGANVTQYYAWLQISESFGTLLLIAFGLLLNFMGFGAVMLVFSVALFSLTPFVFYNTDANLILNNSHLLTQNTSVFSTLKHVFTDANLCIALSGGFVGALKKNGITVLVTFLFSKRVSLDSAPLGFASILFIAFFALNLGAFMPATACFQKHLHSCEFGFVHFDPHSSARRRLVSNCTLVFLVCTTSENVLLGIVATVWSRSASLQSADEYTLWLLAFVFGFVSHFVNGITSVIHRTKAVNLVGIRRIQLQTEFFGLGSISSFIGGFIGLQISAALYEEYGLGAVLVYYTTLTFLQIAFFVLLWFRIARLGHLK